MNNPFNFFDKIYCINLKERKDRWDECLSNFEKYEINNYERFDAIKINADLPSKKKGQIGCALSFTSCVKEAINKNYNQILILEDDFIFHDEKNELFNKFSKSINDLPVDWDCLYLGGTVGDFYGILPFNKFTDNLFKLKCAHTTHSIAFSRKGMLKMVNFFKDKQNWQVELINNYEAIDIFLAKDYQKNTLSFITSELLCYQRISESNIESNVYDYSEWMNRNFNYFKTILL